MGHVQNFTVPRIGTEAGGTTLAMVAPGQDDVPRPSGQEDHDRRATATGETPLIVVVDDDASIVEGLCILLESWGFSVLRSLTLDELGKRLPNAAGRAGLVIADHFLPAGGTGLEAVEMVRRHAGTEVPAIILTGDTTPERRAEAEAMHCRLLHKPIQVGPLREAVESLVQR